MQTPIELRHALVTQKSKRQRLIYDSVQANIDDTIRTLKSKQKNAIIRNLVYNIDNQLVVAQLFINRLNGFVPTEETRFGTMPTAYQIQLRFVHGYETALGDQPVFISNGSFEWRNIRPREIAGHITDDIYHEMRIEQGERVNTTYTQQTLKLENEGRTQSISVPWSAEEGKGYEEYGIGGAPQCKYYFNMSDYQQRHKLNTVYALCYAEPDHETPYRWHPEYPGYTQAQEGEYETHDTAGAEKRLKYYRNWVETIDSQLRDTPWSANYARSRLEQNPYRLDMISVNGIYLYADSGLTVDRLYDYQVELVQLITGVYHRIRSEAQSNQLPNSTHMSVIDMGVGAGKTYIINTVLKHFSRTYLDPKHAPSFCMSPDPALAHVMVRIINKQDGIAQIISTAITGETDIPNANFLQRYQRYAQIACHEILDIKSYIDEGLQDQILQYCRDNGLHPFVIMNELYSSEKSCQLYQNSIDVKRLLLLIEGQKLIMQKTGLSPIIALRRLYDELEKIMTGITKATDEKLFSTITQNIPSESPAENKQICYNQNVLLPQSLKNSSTRDQEINFLHITATRLSQLLVTKFSYNRNPLGRAVAIRNVLLKIACLNNRNAATLLANGGGLANTHTQEELDKQIGLFIEPAAEELRRVAAKTTPMTYLEHRCYFLYINEIFATIPYEIDARSKYRDAWDRSLLPTSLSLNYQLLVAIRDNIAQKLASLTQSEHIDRQYGATAIEAVDRMAGHVGLVLPGKLENDAAKLLSTHVPVFSPEGFVAYLEHLVRSEGQPLLQVAYEASIYKIQSHRTVVTRHMIQERLVQIFNAVMLADEIHKEAYQFLYDANNPLYQRVNQITQHYLQHEFREILPHRIGMSGTVNQIARQAFGEHTLYSLPLQDMIQRQLTKQFNITRFSCHSPNLWSDYCQVNRWWNVSKGIIFSKQAQTFSVETVNTAFDQVRNQLLIHYLEFILQKNGTCKELSELVGIQNTLYAEPHKVDLCTAFMRDHDIECLQDITRSLRNISPDLITETDVTQYVQRAMHNENLQKTLRELILIHKNDVKTFIQALFELDIPLSDFVTVNINDFEDGLSQVLLGTEAQQSGYSHEFVGAVVDASILAIRDLFLPIDQSVDGMSQLYNQLQAVLKHSFSYDEKNQIGGRALRTSSGIAHYIEYMSPDYNGASVFNLETSFADIFIEDKAQAKTLRDAVMLHRLLLQVLIEHDIPSFPDYVDHVLQHCQTYGLLADYEGFMANCLPAWWSLKHEPMRVLQENYDDLAAVVTAKLNEQLQAQAARIQQTNNDTPMEPGWETRPQHHNQRISHPAPFSVSILLEWMTHPISVTAAATVLLAGLGILSAIALSLLANALLAMCAKGMVIAGTVLLLPAISKACCTFFQNQTPPRLYEKNPPPNPLGADRPST